MKNIFNNEDQRELYLNSKVVPKESEEIMLRYLQLRKLAKSYWGFYTFSLGYCLIYPVINKIAIYLRQPKKIIKYNVLSCLFFSYVFYTLTLKQIVKIFNKKDYEKFRVYCLKYGLEDYILI